MLWECSSKEEFPSAEYEFFLGVAAVDLQYRKARVYHCVNAKELSAYSEYERNEVKCILDRVIFFSTLVVCSFLPAPLNIILFAILTCAQRTRMPFCPSHWILCHLDLYKYDVEFHVLPRCWKTTSAYPISDSSSCRGKPAQAACHLGLHVFLISCFVFIFPSNLLRHRPRGAENRRLTGSDKKQSSSNLT